MAAAEAQHSHASNRRLRVVNKRTNLRMCGTCMSMKDIQGMIYYCRTEITGSFFQVSIISDVDDAAMG